MKRDSSLRTFGGAVAIVTGGASRIGRALAETLVRFGATVVFADLQADLAGRKRVSSGLASGGETMPRSNVAEKWDQEGE